MNLARFPAAQPLGCLVWPLAGAMAGLLVGHWLERTLFLPVLVIGGPAALLCSATASLAGSVLQLVRLTTPGQPGCRLGSRRQGGNRATAGVVLE